MIDRAEKTHQFGTPDFFVWCTFTVSCAVFCSAFIAPLSLSIVRLLLVTVLILSAFRVIRDRKRIKNKSNNHYYEKTKLTGLTPPLVLVLLCFFFRLNTGFLNFIPPNHDALHHINQIDHILRFNSLGLESIYGNITGPASNIDPRFYPHSSHVIVALHSLFDADAVWLTSLVTLMMISVVMPLGLYLMFISFDFSRVTSLISSGFVLSIGMVPNGPLSWGGIPTLYGLALFPIWIAWLNSEVGRLAHPSERTRPNLVPIAFTLLKVGAAGFALLLVHPSSGFLFIVVAFLRFMISARIGNSLKITLFAASGTMLFLPNLAFLPGSRVVKEIGNVAPFYGDIALQAGQILLLSPNTAFRYWHLIVIPLVLVAAVAQTQQSSRGVDQNSRMLNERRRWLLVLVGAIWVLQLSVLTLNIPSVSGFSWASSLWYRQYARTAYHVPLVTGLLVSLALERLWRCRTTNRNPRVRRSITAGLALVFLLLSSTFVAGIATQRAHSESIQGIGPLSSQELNELVSFFDSEVDLRSKELFLAADFNSGGSLLSVALGIPSDAEPYGRQDVVGGLHSLLDVNSSLGELHSYSLQFGDVIVMTNATAPGGSMSDELFRSSGHYRQRYEANGITLWELREVSVSVGSDLPVRTDLFGGSPVFGLYAAESSSVSVQIETFGQPPFELTEQFSILKPPCEMSGWEVVIPDLSPVEAFDIETTVLDDRVVVDISGSLSEDLFVFPLKVNVESPCTLDGDTQPALAFVLGS